jgi:hypothetical protein
MTIPGLMTRRPTRSSRRVRSVEERAGREEDRMTKKEYEKVVSSMGRRAARRRPTTRRPLRRPRRSNWGPWGGALNCASFLCLEHLPVPPRLRR